MSINLTDEIDVKTKKGKLGAAKQIFLEGDTQTVEKEIQDINSRHNTLNTKHESLSRTVQGIAETGGANTATNVTYNNDISGLNSENAQDAIDEVSSIAHFAKKGGVVNISTNYNSDHIVEVLTLSQALSKVPMTDRVLGFQGKYLATDGWHTIIYTGNSLTDWGDTTKWTDLADKVFNSISKNATFAGIATPTTNPGTPDGPVFYIANGKGIYTNFGNIDITEDEVVVLYYDNIWHKNITGIASKEKLTELGREIGQTIELSDFEKYSGYINDSGVWAGTLSDNFKHIIVPVRKGEEYYAKRNVVSAFYYAFLKSYKTPEEGKTPDYCEGTSASHADEIVLIVPDDANYLYIRAYISPADRLPSLFELRGLKSKVKELSGLTDSLKSEVDKNSSIIKKLKGKKVVCFGDSLTEFQTEGKGYPEWLAEMSEADVVNAGIGGSRILQRSIPTLLPSSESDARAALDICNMVSAWVHGEYKYAEAANVYLKENTVYDYTKQIDKLKSNPVDSAEIVIIMGGTNDFTGGSILENMRTALAAALKEILMANKTIKIYVLTPLVRYITIVAPENWSDVFVNALGYKLYDYCKGIISTAVENHIPVKDMYNSMGWNIENFTYFSDGDTTHPYNGWKPIAEKVYEFVCAEGDTINLSYTEEAYKLTKEIESVRQTVINAIDSEKIIGELEDGMFINKNTGEAEISSDSSVTDFIKVQPRQKIKVDRCYLYSNRSICSYSANKFFIESIAATLSDTTVEFIVPQHVEYIRVTSRLGVKPIIKVTEGITLTDSTNKKVMSVPSNIEYVEIQGKFIGSNADEVIDPNYACTDFIPVIGGHTIIVDKALAVHETVLYFYDIHKNGLSRVKGANLSLTSEQSVNIPINAKYIRVNKYKGYRTSGKLLISYLTNPEYAEKYVDRTVELWGSTIGMRLDRFLQVVGTKPILSICDDDTAYDAIPYLKDICDEEGIKCNFACVASKLESGTNHEELTQRLLEYEEQGFHIVNHSYSHGYCWNDNKPEFSTDECYRDLVKAQRVLRQKGFVDSDWLVTPFGSSSVSLQAVARKAGMNALINSADNSMNHYGQNGRYRIRRILIAPTQELSYYKSLIDEAIRNGDWLVLETHTDMPEQWDGNLVRSIIQYAKSKSIDIMTIGEAFRLRKVCYDIYDIFKLSLY